MKQNNYCMNEVNKQINKNKIININTNKPVNKQTNEQPKSLSP